jgi:hypothetical protein
MDLTDKFEFVLPTVLPSWASVADLLSVFTVNRSLSPDSHMFRDLLREIHSVYWPGDSSSKFDAVPAMLRSIPPEVVSQFLGTSLRVICELIVKELPRMACTNGEIHCLPKQKANCISFTPMEAFILISSCFLGLPLIYPKQRIPRRGGTFHLFFTSKPSVCAKLHCMLNYLNLMIGAVTGAMDPEASAAFVDARRRIQLERLVDGESLGMTFWCNSASFLVSVDYKARGERIESQVGAFHADFANKSLGGGVLRRGCVQEEIRFIIAPETLLSVMLCESMDSNEAIIIRNTFLCSDYSGYSASFKCLGFSTDVISCLTRKRGHLPLHDIVAIDAIFFGDEGHLQFDTNYVLRELAKCRVGLSYLESKPFATGNWGCGVYGGDTQLKAIIQWLAASVSGKMLIYCPFDDERSSRFPNLVASAKARSLTVGALASFLFAGLENGLIRPGTCIDFLLDSIDRLTN